MGTPSQWVTANHWLHSIPSARPCPTSQVSVLPFTPPFSWLLSLFAPIPLPGCPICSSSPTFSHPWTPGPICLPHLSTACQPVLPAPSWGGSSQNWGLGFSPQRFPLPLRSSFSSHPGRQASVSALPLSLTDPSHPTFQPFGDPGLACPGLTTPCVLPPASKPFSCAHSVPLAGTPPGFSWPNWLPPGSTSDSEAAQGDGDLACLPLCSGCSGPSPVRTRRAVLHEEERNDP